MIKYTIEKNFILPIIGEPAELTGKRYINFVKGKFSSY